MADLQKIERRKERKQERNIRWCIKHLPKMPGYAYKKRHLNESLKDFKERVKVRNKRRRSTKERI